MAARTVEEAILGDWAPPVPVYEVDHGMARARMSFEEWRALPDKPKVEFVDGWGVWELMPPTPPHGRAQLKLGSLLLAAFPDLIGYAEVDTEVAHERVRIPDLVLTTEESEGDMLHEPPVLVVEVHSPSTRRQDRNDKAAEYARMGVGQYWMLDPRRHTLEILRLADGAWEPVVTLDESHPEAEVGVGEHGTVHLDLREILHLR